jgi:hypothetical protein
VLDGEEKQDRSGVIMSKETAKEYLIRIHKEAINKFPNDVWLFALGDEKASKVGFVSNMHKTILKEALTQLLYHIDG